MRWTTSRAMSSSAHITKLSFSMKLHHFTYKTIIFCLAKQVALWLWHRTRCENNHITLNECKQSVRRAKTMKKRYEMNNNNNWSHNGRDAMKLWSHNQRKEEQKCGVCVCVLRGVVGLAIIVFEEKHEPIDTNNGVCTHRYCFGSNRQ